MTFTLTSPAFADGAPIPRPYTCDGGDAVPPLAWSSPPAGTQSFALVMDDPDAPGGTFTHWLVYDIPASARALDDTSAVKTLPNGFGRLGYGGPCPPAGDASHHYVFTLHALDVPALQVRGRARAALERELAAHTVAVARLTGLYARQGRGSRLTAASTR